MNWSKRYRLAALDDDYKQLFDKFSLETAFEKKDDPRRQAFKAYTSVPLKDGTTPDYSFWDNIDPVRSLGITKNRQDLLDHEALMRVCDKWSKTLAQASNGDTRSGKSYYWPAANHLAELRDWHRSQFQPQLGEGIFEPPTHREQITRKRRSR